LLDRKEAHYTSEREGVNTFVEIFLRREVQGRFSLNQTNLSQAPFARS
jgi:hypothetical protein